MATTTQRGNEFKRMSANRRSATAGNKHVTMTKKSQSSAMSQHRSTAGTFARTHTGPFLGKRSV